MTTSSLSNRDEEKVVGLAETAESSPSTSRDASPPTFNEQTNYVPTKQIVTVFVACAVVEFVALMDQNTLAAALPVVSGYLRAGSQQAWISGAYFVTTTAFTLIFGRLSDIWSRKTVLLGGLLIFFLGSLASSLAQTATQLIIFRAFTGVGGGGLATVAQAIVSDVVPLRERGKWQGILGAAVAIAHGVGPIVGGAFVEIGGDSWRWIFRLNLPLSAIVTLCVIFMMPLKKVHGNWLTKFLAVDWAGMLLTLASSTLLVLGLIWAGGDHPWLSAHVITTLISGVVVALLFLLWQAHGATLPLVPLYIFKSPLVNGACLTHFINGWNSLVQIYYIPSFYQLALSYPPLRAATMLLPLTITQTVASTTSGLVVYYTGRYRESILVGWAVWAIGLGLYSTIDESTGLGKQIGYAILTGVGIGQTMQPSLVAIQAGVDRKDMAVVTCTRAFLRSLGGVLGLAISGTILNNSLRGKLDGLGLGEEDVRRLLNARDSVGELTRGVAEREEVRAAVVEGYKSGFRVIFISLAGLAGFAAVLAAVLMPHVSLVREDDERLKAEGRKFVDDRKKGAEESKQ
ncbi:MFS transporter-like protein 77 [Elsinoe australis]|uniref:MFS transporter-like protein 77 n=1 Tax=Elsinoe australis TaxID=40998 RepID=A0A4U7AX62_9PEZI|nr:MFS transporter-like protein 77 [Elsinoe australis]